jgi:hypothetical protein
MHTLRRTLPRHATQIAEIGAKQLAAETRARAATMRRMGESADEIEAVLASAKYYDDLAAAFGSGTSYHPSYANHREVYRKGLTCC